MASETTTDKPVLGGEATVTEFGTKVFKRTKHPAPDRNAVTTNQQAIYRLREWIASAYLEGEECPDEMSASATRAALLEDLKRVETFLSAPTKPLPEAGRDAEPFGWVYEENTAEGFAPDWWETKISVGPKQPTYDDIRNVRAVYLTTPEQGGREAVAWLRDDEFEHACARYWNAAPDIARQWHQESEDQRETVRIRMRAMFAAFTTPRSEEDIRKAVVEECASAAGNFLMLKTSLSVETICDCEEVIRKIEGGSTHV